MEEIPGPRRLRAGRRRERAALEERAQGFNDVERLALRLREDPARELLCFAVGGDSGSSACSNCTVSSKLSGPRSICATVTSRRRPRSHSSSAGVVANASARRQKSSRTRVSSCSQRRLSVVQHVQRGDIGPLHVVDEEHQRGSVCNSPAQTNQRFEQPGTSRRLVPARDREIRGSDRAAQGEAGSAPRAKRG